MISKKIFKFFTTVSIFFSGELVVIGETHNSGLGPLEIRPQFLVNQPFLAMYPENTMTLKKGESRFSIGMEIANTFVNTQGPTNQITKKELKRGLILSDFLNKEGEEVRGFSLYLDAESKRKKIKYKFGISDSLEFKLEIPYITFDGGYMDNSIESFHNMIGISNFDKGGAYRALSEKNQYAYYVVKDGKFVYSTSKQIHNIRGEPDAGIKWNLFGGGEIFPAITFKITYKFANKDRSGEQKLIRSGGMDWGHYLMFSKGFQNWIIYFGDGETKIGESHDFANSLSHRFMAMEYRVTGEDSFIFQTVSQSSIFPKTNANPRSSSGEFQEQRNSNLSVPTSVSAFGYKFFSGTIFWESGFVQDYNNFGNETDFVFFWEIGVNW
tara:strand:+ start:2145 stop:3290 length:1146 start_codon:yes stop_codon:yes gene_type:complete